MAWDSKGEFEIGGQPVTWVCDGAQKAAPTIILAHGAGAPYTHPFMEATAAGLVKRGLVVVRFHFPYMENVVRTGRRRPPNAQKVLLETWQQMLDLVASWPGVGPITLAGKSMGGRMASMLLADPPTADPIAASAAVYLGYPLHPPGKHDKLRSAHLPRVPVPQLFVSGTKDNLCRLDLLQPVLAEIGDRARLHTVDGGDHSLATSRKEPLAGSDVWLDRVAAFVKENSS